MGWLWCQLTIPYLMQPGLTHDVCTILLPHSPQHSMNEEWGPHSVMNRWGEEACWPTNLSTQIDDSQEDTAQCMMYTTTYQDAYGGQLRSFTPSPSPQGAPGQGTSSTPASSSTLANSPSSWSASDNTSCSPSAPPLPRHCKFDASIVQAQIGMSDDEALKAALVNDQAEQEHQQVLQLLSTQQWHPPQDETQLANDALLARALAEEDAELNRMRARAAETSREASPSLIYPEMLSDDGRDMMISRRLSQVPHVELQPRVNGAWHSYQPPVSEDRARLLVRLDEYGLVERQVKGDGACQFRSLSDQLYGSPEHHDVVRKAMVQQLLAYPDSYAHHVPTQFRSYCHDMSLPHTWGDHVTLKAASDWYGIRIIVLTSFKDNFVLAIEPRHKKSSRVLWLSFWAEVHYNSIYPREEPPGAYASAPKLLGSKQLGRLFMS